jgi:hypothetical protein
MIEQVAAEVNRLWLVGRLEMCRQELEDRVVALIRGTPGTVSGDEDVQFRLGQRDAVAACLKCWLMAVERGERWSGPAPPEVDVQARRAAHRGVRLSTALSRYAVAHEFVWGVVLREAEAIEDSGVQIELLTGAWASTASVFACFVHAMTEAHTAELGAQRKTRKRRDDERILDVLAGRPGIDLEGIDYDFDGHHLGLIATGGEARDALRLLARTLNCRVWLVERENGSVWGWLASKSKICTNEVEGCLLKAHHGIRLVGGRGERGLAGFCLTHKQAQTALHVAHRRPRQQVTWYADVEPVALIIQHEDLARSMIATWITPIVAQSNGLALLKTLQAFLACSQNLTQTAKVLPAGLRTVKRHLNRIGELVGQPPQACAAELEIALRVYKLWGEEEEQQKG